MTRRIALLAALALAATLPVAALATAQKPAGPLEVTYYYLPG